MSNSYQINTHRTHHMPSPAVQLQLQLVADQGTFSDAGITPAVNGGPVQQWHDTVGGAVYAGAGGAPAFAANQNGVLPAVSHSGAHWLQKAAPFRPGDARGTMYVVFRTDDATDGQCLFGAGEDALCRFCLCVMSGKLMVEHIDTGVTNQVVGTTALVNGAWYCLMVASTGGNWRARLNGHTEALSVAAGGNVGAWFSGLSSNVMTSAGRRCVGDNHMQGDIAEIRYYSATHTTQEFGTVERELSAKWAI